ncbi:hypothetical protein FHG87_007313 [Trinorchestia longiramus]|nr:hypothetical protein FHG87_007313 [Trinorchestia longiramus]
MAAGRGPRGGTTWSRCSREAFALQNGRCLWDTGKTSVWDEAGRGVLPGQRFDAVSQCQLFFRDHDATLTWPSNLKKLCNSVQCSSPHRLTSYLAGPALEGTYCGGTNWCRAGKCVPWSAKDNVTVVTERFTVAVSRDTAGLFEYRDPPSLDDLVIKAGPPVNDPLDAKDYPEFDLDDLY